MKKIVLVLFLALAMINCSKDDDPVISYTVTFDAGGGTPVPSAQKVEEGSTVTAPSTNPTKAGYVFVYWYLGGTTTAYNFQAPVDKDITLHAKWQEEATAEYWQVTWNLNGGAWPSDDNHAILVIKGGTLSEPNAPTKTGNTLVGWYKESGLTNKITFPYNISNVTSNFTLYAKWEKETGEENPGSFTSVAAFSAWLKKQPENTVETAYNVKLKNINLDSGNNWDDLGVAVGVTNKTKFVDLDLSGCTGTTIPDGRQERKQEGNIIHITYYGVFVGCANLVSVTLPDGLTSIGDYAFYECTNLLTASLPKSLTSIGKYAFKRCEKLHTATLPDGLKRLGPDAFAYNNLTSVTVPGSVNDWDESAFSNCYVLHTVVIKEGVERIGKKAFMNCDALESVTLPAGLKAIDYQAFWGCDILKTITLPKELEIIGNEAFHSCKLLSGSPGLTGMEIPSKVKEIGQEVFQLTKITEYIMRPVSPPVLGHVGLGDASIGRGTTIKVPAASVDTYKAAPEWSLYKYYIVANTD